MLQLAFKVIFLTQPAGDHCAAPATDIGLFADVPSGLSEIGS